MRSEVSRQQTTGAFDFRVRLAAGEVAPLHPWAGDGEVSLWVTRHMYVNRTRSVKTARSQRTVSCPAGCPVGQQLNAAGTACELCPVGTYKDGINQDACTPCTDDRPNSSTRMEGANSIDLCRTFASCSFFSRMYPNYRPRRVTGHCV